MSGVSGVPTHFGVDMQKLILKVIVQDDSFGRLVQPHIEPHFFENEALAWVYTRSKEYADQYGKGPSFGILGEMIWGLGSPTRDLYMDVLDTMRQTPLSETDETWVRDKTMDWIRRNIFVRAFHESQGIFNQGKADEAYDFMRTKMDEIGQTTWAPIDQTFFFDDLHARHIQRIHDVSRKPIGTGIPDLDKIFEGGLHLGELGIFISYPKVGKTTMLVNLGIVATRAFHTETAHFVFEGSRVQIENRYDAAFMDEIYSAVKSGNVDAGKYARAHAEYKFLKGRLVIRAFVDQWDYNCGHIESALKDLKRNHGWVPKLILVDYLDLLKAREKMDTEFANQKASCRDLKNIANRGYAVWSASQVQRPRDPNFETTPHELCSRDIADCYEKIRIADFIGSLNQTIQEAEMHLMRIYAELYRDNVAHRVITMPINFSKMQFGHNADPKGALQPSYSPQPKQKKEKEKKQGKQVQTKVT